MECASIVREQREMHMPEVVVPVTVGGSRCILLHCLRHVPAVRASVSAGAQVSGGRVVVHVLIRAAVVVLSGRWVYGGLWVG